MEEASCPLAAPHVRNPDGFATRAARRDQGGDGALEEETTMIYAKWAKDDERDRAIANSVFGDAPEADMAIAMFQS